MKLNFKIVSTVIMTITMLCSFNVLAEESLQRKLAAKLLEHFGYSNAILWHQKQSRELADEVMYYYPCKDKEIVSKKLDVNLEERFRIKEIKNQFIDVIVATFTEKDLEKLLRFIDLPPKEPIIWTQLMDLTRHKFANTVKEDPKWFFEYSPKDPEVLMEFEKTPVGKKVKTKLPSVLLECRELRNSYLGTFHNQYEMNDFVGDLLDSNEQCKKIYFNGK